jgi:hypothetical protein
MVVEPESFCWSTGRLANKRDGPTWAEELRGYSSLEYIVRDGGTGLSKGISLIQAERPQLRDGLDVFHTFHEGAKALRQTWSAASRALEAADGEQKRFDRLGRQGKSRQGKGGPLKRAWDKAEQRMDQADHAEQAFGQIKQALALFTPEGKLNDRTRAERIIREQLPHLTGPQWNKTRRLLQRPETFTFLDRLHEALGRLEMDENELDAALRFEGLRRCRWLWRDETPQAAVARGLVMVETVRLQKDRRWQEVIAQVRHLLRGCWRASSLVEGINSVARMHQSRHRKMTQGLLDLKRLYWNMRPFRTGRRRGKSPYALLDLKLPTHDWWELLRLPPDQLAQHLSTQ